MCRRWKDVDQKQRRTIAAANGFLAAGLAIWNLASRASGHHQPWLHAVSGFLLGLSIALNLGAVVKRRHASEHSA